MTPKRLYFTVHINDKNVSSVAMDFIHYEKDPFGMLQKAIKRIVGELQVRHETKQDLSGEIKVAVEVEEPREV